MKKKTDQIALTASRFSALIGCDRNEILKRLAEQKAEPTGRKNGGDEYSLRSLFQAAIGGDVTEQRLRKLRAEADKLEYDLATKRRDLIPVGEVEKLVIHCFTAIREIIWRSPLEEIQRRDILHQLMALKTHDWSKEAPDL